MEGPKQTPHRSGLRTALGLVALAAWLCMVIGGLAFVAGYDNTPGRTARHGSQWPARADIELDPAVPTLVMVAHPLCTCTRASLDELSEIVARARGGVRAYVLFATTDRLRANPMTTALWHQASRIAGVRPVADELGRQAALFGAATSGQVYLYSPAGALLFSGGTTRSRGHAGENIGRTSIVALLARQAPPRTATPVFGCPLDGRADPPSTPADHDHDDHRTP